MRDVMQLQAGSMQDEDKVVEALRKAVVEALPKAADAEKGYADFDRWPDQQTKDHGLGQEFTAALCAHFNISIKTILPVPRDFDPPDLIADGSIGIELTEFVDPEMVRAAARRKRAGETRDQYRHWEKDEFLARIKEIVLRKDAGTPKTRDSWDQYWLVIHTDEPELTPEIVESYLRDWSPIISRLLTRCFLLMSYFPSHEGRPLFEIIVQKAA